MNKAILFLSIINLLLWSCGRRQSEEGKLFRLLDPKKTGITFSNGLQETYEMNVIEYQDFYSGGGVSIGDVDNDGLSDIFFTGNQVPARLYKNLGEMVFENITAEAGLARMGRGWYTGTSMVDINNDGYLDIYISKSGMEAPDDRANLLYINDGTGAFTEKAKEYGIDHRGFAVNATFFDYDRDGDLDLYLVNQGPIKLKSGNAQKLRAERHSEAGDVLFEHIDGKFIDVTDASGLFSSVIGFAHGVAIGDVNNDGWDDIFVSNDFFEYDYLYINNHDKTFTETIKEATNHISYYSMGNDMADFDNDGLLDIVVVDMIAEDNRRLYSNLGGMNMYRFKNHIEMGLHHQYMFNVLHLNNGNETFSEIGTLSGISRTDWSWAPLFADFDNDGWKDLYVTNGIRKDVRNIDWGYFYHDLVSLSGGQNIFSESQWDMLLKSMPSEPVANYMFRNNGDLTFSKVMHDWGIDEKSWSNGVAFGDLDNDGDLDLVVNNIDQEAFVYENKQRNNHFIRFGFRGPDKNPMALGTKVKIFHHGNMQFQQHYLARGYRSSMEPVMHFGLGRDSLVQKVEVWWPDGKRNTYYDLKANRMVVVNYSDAVMAKTDAKATMSNYFKDVTEELGLDVRHTENEMEDFMREPMLPFRMSMFGPALAVGDVNGDGLDDIYLGGAFRRPGQLLIQDALQTFSNSSENLWKVDRMYEDVDAAFFDIENDGDLDLYVVSGGNENTFENGRLLDRLYLNDGSGNFSRSTERIDSVNCSGSVVVPADFDKDGDLDVFVGGRMIPAKYPLPADSYLLANENGRLMDATDNLVPELRTIGLVTDAIWSDYDSDDDLDLIIVGEWMPVTVFNNDSGKLSKLTNEGTGLEFSSGWWWTIVSSDFDNDGDEDFVTGNMGLNYKFAATEQSPIEMFTADFDENSTLDIAMGYHQDGKLYSMISRAKILRQNPYLKEKLSSNNDFATSTIYDIYGAHKLDLAMKLNIHTLATSYIENKGEGTFEIIPFENKAQISNVNSVVIYDVNRDGNDDLIMAGNLYPMEVETIRNDGGIGLFLKGNGIGIFESSPFVESGLYLSGDIRHLRLAQFAMGPVLVCAKNNDRLQFIQISAQEEKPVN